AEDGIRDFHVTGVQTCALPIFDHITQLLPPAGGSVDVLESGPAMARRYAADQGDAETLDRPLASYDLIIWHGGLDAVQDVPAARSEERRVGKEGRHWRAPERSE